MQKQQQRTGVEQQDKQQKENNDNTEQSGLNQFGRPKQQVIFYQLTDDMKDMAVEKLAKDKLVEDQAMYQKAQNQTQKVWDKFYKFHKCSFFKDRTYLEREIKPITIFKELFKQTGKISQFVELGCGVGNTIFPLLRQYQCFNYFGFDISAKAIDLIRQQMQKHPQYQERLKVEVCDLAKHELPFKGNGDLNTLIFVLSAIVPEKHLQVMEKISAWMKPGSFLYFRDYGRYDFGQLNLSSKGNRKIRDNFYMKNDGVCVYYFQLQELIKMCQKVGLVPIKVSPLCKLLQNRKRGLKMYRVWLQGLFYKPPMSEEMLQRVQWMKKAYEEAEQMVEVQKIQVSEENKQIKGNTEEKLQEMLGENVEQDNKNTDEKKQ